MLPQTGLVTEGWGGALGTRHLAFPGGKLQIVFLNNEGKFHLDLSSLSLVIKEESGASVQNALAQYFPLPVVLSDLEPGDASAGAQSPPSGLMACILDEAVLAGGWRLQSHPGWRFTAVQFSEGNQLPGVPHSTVPTCPPSPPVLFLPSIVLTPLISQDTHSCVP